MDVSDNHAQVVVCIVQDPGVRLREIGERVGERVGITERAAHRIVTELADAGDITRRRNGHTINAHLPLPDPIAREQNGSRASRTSGSCSSS